jgi:hypothetical protein
MSNKLEKVAHVASHLKEHQSFTALARFIERLSSINIVKVLNYTFNEILGPFIKPHSQVSSAIF